MFDPRQILGISSVYSAFQVAIGGKFRRTYVNQYVRPQPGMRILDIGCGPGDILKELDASIDYTGIDLSAAYIDSARRRFGERGRFLCESVSNLAVRESHSFDLVLANGVIHHLDDSEVRQLFTIAKQALKPDGWFVSLDGCFVPGQSPIARYLLARDRGLHVRDLDGYLKFAREVFPEIVADVRHDLLRVPYTHLILRCSPRTKSAVAAA